MDKTRGMTTYKMIKRVLDLFFAAILCVVLSPVMLICYLAVKLSSSGPAIFLQKRPGKGSKIFTILKFRTMRNEPDHNGKPNSDMERMTRVGNILRKLSLDELPQLFNIMKGDMSFIGPRPLLVEYLPRYNPYQARRHEVRPGITGWAQVNGRNALTWDQKFELDIYYVNNMSFELDFYIVLMTILTVFKRSGINQGESNTMDLFMGSKEQS